MKTKKFHRQTLKAAAAFLFATTLSAGFSSCGEDYDKDDLVNNKSVSEFEPMMKYDDLSYFQNAFVEVDSVGNFVNRSVGVPFHDDDSMHIYVGVNNMEEALTFWQTCLAPDIEQTVSPTNKYMYALTDQNGMVQGVITFAPGTEIGHVAEITTNLAGLKHFNKVTFLQNDVWPLLYNPSKGKYRLGDTRTMEIKYGRSDKGWWNETVTFVCVREKSNGVKPLYVAITNKLHNPSKTGSWLLCFSDYCPGETKAKLISDLLRKDWVFFEACFREAGGGPLNRGEGYWYDADRFIGYRNDHGCIRLDTGETSWWDYMWHNPEKHVLLKIDWEDD